MKDCIIKGFRYTNSTGRNLLETYKEEYQKSLCDFLNKYKDNTESLYLDDVIEEWTELIPEFKGFINSIKKHQDEAFYYIRNRIITIEESQEINEQIEVENKRLSIINMGISINEKFKERELEEEKCIELLNNLLATGSKFLEFLKNRLKEIEDVKPENKNPFPLIFTGNDDKAYNVFMDFKKIITDYYPDYSFVFQKMKAKTEMLIEKRCRHKEFMDWLLENEYISKTVYNDFIERESFSTKYDRGMRATQYNRIKEKHFPINSDLSE